MVSTPSTAVTVMIMRAVIGSHLLDQSNAQAWQVVSITFPASGSIAI